MKTIAQITAALNNKYTGPIKEINGFSYISWNDMVAHLNTELDIDGYDIETISTRQEQVTNPEGHTTYGYSAVVRLTVHSSDGRSFHRDGVGFNELQFTKSGTALTDTSLKGAASGAITRAAALLGDFGGLFLYDKTHKTNNYSAPASNNTPQVARPQSSNRPPLSEKQEGVLRNKKFSAAVINQIQTTLNWQQAKELMTDVFAGESAADIANKYKLSRVAVPAGSEFPAELDEESEW